MSKIYLLPLEVIGNARGPKYFSWRDNPNGITSSWALMDYGFLPYGLLVAEGISDQDHAELLTYDDVYAFPDDLTAGVKDQRVDTFFESINLPAKWLTPAVTYLELLRLVAGIMQLNQRYGGISNGSSLFENSDLDTRLRDLSPEEIIWFEQSWASFGLDPSELNHNLQLRTLLLQFESVWIDRSFYLGGFVF